MHNLQSADTDLKLRREVFAWCLRNARRCLKSESPGGAAQWCLVAARLAGRYEATAATPKQAENGRGAWTVEARACRAGQQPASRC